MSATSTPAPREQPGAAARPWALDPEEEPLLQVTVWRGEWWVTDFCLVDMRDSWLAGPYSDRAVAERAMQWLGRATNWSTVGEVFEWLT